MLSLTANKSAFQPGDALVFTITGGPPNAAFSWTSFKNNQNTGEYLSYYGHRLDANGSAVLPAGNWKATDIGNWEKRIDVLDANGAVSGQHASVLMTVGSVSQPAGQQGQTQQTGNFFTDSTDLPGIGTVPNWAFIVGGGLLLLVFMGGKK
jgi:hypothetical protein